MKRASALPTPAAETYTAHSTAIPAVQFNTVYPTPCTAVPSISFGSASDKRYSLGRASSSKLRQRPAGSLAQRAGRGAEAKAGGHQEASLAETGRHHFQ
jgi:hypothetical protein